MTVASNRRSERERQRWQQAVALVAHSVEGGGVGGEGTVLAALLVLVEAVVAQRAVVYFTFIILSLEIDVRVTLFT